MWISLLVCLTLNSLVTRCFYAIIAIVPSTPREKNNKSEPCGVCTLGPVQKSDGQDSDQPHLMLMLTLC